MSQVSRHTALCVDRLSRSGGRVCFGGAVHAQLSKKRREMAGFASASGPFCGCSGAASNVFLQQRSRRRERKVIALAWRRAFGRWPCASKGCLLRGARRSPYTAPPWLHLASGSLPPPSFPSTLSVPTAGRAWSVLAAGRRPSPHEFVHSRFASPGSKHVLQQTFLWPRFFPKHCLMTCCQIFHLIFLNVPAKVV